MVTGCSVSVCGLLSHLTRSDVSPLYTKMIAGNYLGDGDTGEVIIGKSVAGDPSIRQEDEFQPSLGGVRVGDPITIEYGNGYTRDYQVKGIYSTGWSEADNTVYVTMSDMEIVEGKALDRADYITVKAKPGYSEKFIKDELQSYGVAQDVQTTADLLSKSLGRVLQSFAIINMVSLIVSIVITTVVLFVVITIKTLSSRKQIGILKAIGVDKEVIMHTYGFQVIILAAFGILLGILLTSLLALYMSVHPVVTPEWSAYHLPDPHGHRYELPDPVRGSNRRRLHPRVAYSTGRHPKIHEVVSGNDQDRRPAQDLPDGRRRGECP